MYGDQTYEGWKARQAPELRAAIDEEYRRILEEADDLKSLRLLVEMSQAELAEGLGTTQSAVSRLERRSDLTLRTLRGIVGKLGGEVDIVVRLPGRRPIRLRRLSDAAPEGEEIVPRPARFRSGTPKE